MLGIDDHADSAGIQYFLDGIGNLPGQPFLNLEPPCVHIGDPRQLGNTDYFVVGDIPDMAFAEERQQMVLAQGINLDVSQDDHVSGFCLEDGIVHDLVQTLGVTLREETECFLRPFRGSAQSFPAGIFPDTLDEFQVHVFQNVPLRSSRIEYIRMLSWEME